MRSLYITRTALVLAALVGVATLGGCGGSSGGGSSASTSNISGTVSAPTSSSALAFNQPGRFKGLFGGIFMSSAQAALSGTVGVAGVTVNLIEIDNSGNQVGAVLASATTGSNGAYTLTPPAGFVAASKYMIRAVGSGSNKMDAFVTGTTVDVDPSTEATGALVLSSIATNASSLAAVTPAAILEMQATIIDQLKDIDPATPLTTVTALVNALKTEISSDQESTNIANSIASPGIISGTVTNSSGAPLSNITIIARDFGDWVTRSKTKTNTSGNYTLHVPTGNYVLGALNHTSSSTAASEWWTSGGGSANQFSAGKVSVPSATPVTKDFVLDAGGRISGKVTAPDGVTPLPGIHIQVRDFSNDQPVAFSRTDSGGVFTVNVRPSVYTLGAYNRTHQPYGTALYNGAASGGTITGGGKDASQATPVSLVAGSSISANFKLAAGYKIAGTVSDPVTGTGAPGVAVRFYKASGDVTTGAFVVGVTTNPQGKYRLWLQPDIYDVDTRGQSASGVNVIAGNSLQNFNASVGRVTATVIDGSGNPVSQAKVRVYDNAGVYKGFEVSDGDGTLTLYSPVTPVLIELKMDGGQLIGSNIYTTPKPTPVTTQLLSGSPVAVDLTGATTATLGLVTLPAGGVLTGTVTRVGAPVANYIVHVRSGGATAANRFVSTRTQGSGTYSISLPATTYNTVRACDPTNCTTGNNSAPVSITANATTNLDLVAP